MKISLYEGIFITGVGLIGLIGSVHLENQLNTMGMVGTMGPAKYTLVVSMILVVCGIIAIIGHLRRSRSATTGETLRIISTEGIILIAVLLAWIAAVSIFGYVIGIIFFFPVLFYVTGLRPWFKSLIVGLITAMLFYAAFVLGVKLPVPKGIWGIW